MSQPTPITASSVDTAAEEAPPRANMSMVEVEGFPIPRTYEKFLDCPLEQHVRSLRSLELRDDDVLLCAYPKTGTHWLWEVSAMLLAGKAERIPFKKESAQLEMIPLRHLNNLPSPRLLNTHLPLRLLPPLVPGDKKVKAKVKVIHTYRNPKDLMVSAFFHLRHYQPERTLESNVAEFLSGTCPMGNYVTFLKEIDSFIKDNPEAPVFNTSFEDMKEDLQGTVRRLAGFLGVEASDDLCADIAQACSFQTMKESDSLKTLPDHISLIPDVQIYRKGEVGNWKHHLTVAASESIDRAMAAELNTMDFRFRYTL